MSDKPKLGKYMLVNPRVDERGHRHIPRPEVAEFVVHTLDGKPFGVFRMAGAFPCATCDAHPGFELVGDTLVAETQCALPEGLISTVHLDVPSGRIVVADTLHPVFDGETAVTPSYNSVAGRVLMAERMSRVGVAQGYAGNTSPHLVKYPSGQMAMISYDPDALPGEEGHVPDVEVLASVCTDVWSYEIADQDDYLTRVGQMPEQERAHLRDVQVVSIEPGTYRIRNLTGLTDREDVHDVWPVTIAHIERVGPCPAQKESA